MPFRLGSSSLTTLALLACCAGSPATGQDANVLANQHAWARFGVGSWKLVRTFAEDLDESGKVERVSIEETKTTLARADANGYTLQVELTIEVSGKRFPSDTVELTYGYNGEVRGQTVTTKDIGEARLNIAGLEYPTLKRRILIESEKLRSLSTTYYSASISPHTLKRTTEATDTKTNQKTYEADVEVFAINMPRRVLTETRLTSHVRKLETYPQGVRKVTVEVLCDSVPGGVVAQTMKQVNESGATVKRSTLDLVDYEVVAKPATPAKVTPAAPTVRRGGLFRRRRKAG